MGCLRWTRTRASGPGIAAGIRRPSGIPIVPSARRRAGTGGNGAGLAKRTRTCAGLHRSGRRRRSCDDDGGRRGLDATRRLPIRRCCCSPRGTPSARGASPRSCVARCRRLPTETWVGSVSRLLEKERRRFDLAAPPRRPGAGTRATAGRSVSLSAGGWAIETHARAARWVIRRCARP